VSEDTGTGTGQGFAGTAGADEPPPMTRRERREREQREAQALAAQTASVPVVEHTTEAPPVVEQEVQKSSAPASLEPAAPAQPAQPMTRRERREMEERMLREQGGPALEPVAPTPAPQPAQTTVDTGVRVVGDEPGTSDSASIGEPEIARRSEAPPATAPLRPVFDTPVAPPRSGFPIAVDDEDTEDAELASSREVGSGSPATHALILPATPNIDIAGPIGDTGEILVTGQIPLPRLVTETGVQVELDEDERFDELIGAETAPLTSPISAKSAVSSKGNDSEFQLVRKAPWGTAATVLGASAVLLVLAAAGLLTLALLTDFLPWPL